MASTITNNSGFSVTEIENEPIKTSSGFSVTQIGDEFISDKSNGFSVTQIGEEALGEKHILDKMNDPHYMPTEEEYYAYLEAEDNAQNKIYSSIKSNIC